MDQYSHQDGIVVIVTKQNIKGITGQEEQDFEARISLSESENARLEKNIDGTTMFVKTDPKTLEIMNNMTYQGQRLVV